MAFDALRIKRIVHGVVCEHNVDDVIPDVAFPLKLQ